VAEHAGSLALVALQDGHVALRHQALGLLATLPARALRPHHPVLSVVAAREPVEALRHRARHLLGAEAPAPGPARALADLLLPPTDEPEAHSRALQHLHRTRPDLARHASRRLLGGGAWPVGPLAVEAARVVAEAATPDSARSVVELAVHALHHADPEHRCTGCAILAAVPDGAWSEGLPRDEVLELLEEARHQDPAEPVRRAADAALAALTRIAP